MGNVTSDSTFPWKKSTRFERCGAGSSECMGNPTANLNHTSTEFVMNLEVKSISIRSATATTLVAELEVELRQDYPPHYIHELDVTSFEAVDGIFLVCLVEDNPIGCLALRPLDPDTAELKRMFVRRRSRGLGAARLMLREMESRAMAKGFKQIVLETGNQQRTAIDLYLASGYESIPPYNKAADGPASVCFQKALGPGGETFPVGS